MVANVFPIGLRAYEDRLKRMDEKLDHLVNRLDALIETLAKKADKPVIPDDKGTP